MLGQIIGPIFFSNFRMFFLFPVIILPATQTSPLRVCTFPLYSAVVLPPNPVHSPLSEAVAITAEPGPPPPPPLFFRTGLPPSTVPPPFLGFWPVEPPLFRTCRYYPPFPPPAEPRQAEFLIFLFFVAFLRSLAVMALTIPASLSSLFRSVLINVSFP